MLAMFITLFFYILFLALLFAAICSITGETSKSSNLMSNCSIAIILFTVVVVMFNFSGEGKGIFSYTIPMIHGVEMHGSILKYIHNDLGAFSFDFVQLVILVFLISVFNNIFNVSANSLLSQIICKFITFFGSLLIYGYFMEFAGENEIIRWCVYIVECLLGGTMIVYTPAMLVANLLGIEPDNKLINYILKELPNTKIGNAISASVTMSINLLIFLAILENQCGTLSNLMSGILDVVIAFGPAVIIIIGIYCVISSLKKK